MNLRRYEKQAKSAVPICLKQQSTYFDKGNTNAISIGSLNETRHINLVTKMTIHDEKC